MKTTYAILLVTSLFCAAPQPAAAQFVYYGRYHASTEAEGAANGISNIIQSAGAANLMHSQAARNYEEARAKALENRVSASHKYYQLRKLNAEYRAAERGPRPTTEQMFRYARDRAPERLSPTDLDPVTGLISWPVVLEQDIYREHRERLDKLFALRAKYGGQIGPDQYLELRNATQALADELKKRIEEYPPADYVRAKSVLDSLAYEAQLTAG